MADRDLALESCRRPGLAAGYGRPGVSNSLLSAKSTRAMSTRVIGESDQEPSGTAHRVTGDHLSRRFRIRWCLLCGGGGARGLRRQEPVPLSLDAFESLSATRPRDRRAFSTAAHGQQSGRTSNSPTMAKFDGTHEKRGVSCRPVRSQDVPAGSSTVTATFAAVQRAQPRSFQGRLQRQPSLPTSLASRRSVAGRDFHRSRKAPVSRRAVRSHGAWA
jgi:hypothetical protein